MGKLYKKLLIEEVALAGNPINGEKFLLIKDGGLDMSDKIKLASLLLSGEDVPAVVKEELKSFLPKEGDNLVFNDNIDVTVDKDMKYHVKKREISKEDKEKLEKYDKVKKDLDVAVAELAKLKKADPDTILKDVPQVIKDRLEKLEKDAVEAGKREVEAGKREVQLKKDAIKKDIEIKVGESITKDIMDVYAEGKEKEINTLVDKIVGMQKMLKDLGKGIGKKGDEDVEKLVKDGIEKIKKDRHIESDADAYVIFCKENPELCKSEEG
ncbi:MAG: hypothetical protein KAU20_05490 [Nanoarchaeota archaeon]|nr:hypothetical protein [Nanoarchaeota archaeon]